MKKENIDNYKGYFFHKGGNKIPYLFRKRKTFKEIQKEFIILKIIGKISQFIMA